MDSRGGVLSLCIVQVCLMEQESALGRVHCGWRRSQKDLSNHLPPLLASSLRVITAVANAIPPQPAGPSGVSLGLWLLPRAVVPEVPIAPFIAAVYSVHPMVPKFGVLESLAHVEATHTYKKPVSVAVLTDVSVLFFFFGSAYTVVTGSWVTRS